MDKPAFSRSTGHEDECGDSDGKIEQCRENAANPDSHPEASQGPEEVQI